MIDVQSHIHHCQKFLISTFNAISLPALYAVDRKPVQEVDALDYLVRRIFGRHVTFVGLKIVTSVKLIFRTIKAILRRLNAIAIACSFMADDIARIPLRPFGTRWRSKGLEAPAIERSIRIKSIADQLLSATSPKSIRGLTETKVGAFLVRIRVTCIGRAERLGRADGIAGIDRAMGLAVDTRARFLPVGPPRTSGILGSEPHQIRLGLRLASIVDVSRFITIVDTGR